MLDPVCGADHVEAHGPGVDGVPVSWLLGELDAVVCQDGVNTIGDCVQEGFEELPGRLAVRFVDQPCHCELAGSVNRHKEIELTLIGAHLGDIGMEVSDGIAFELLAFRFVALHIGQPGYPMALKAAMQRRARQVRDCRLQGV